MKTQTRYMSVDLAHGAGYGNTLTWSRDEKFHSETQPVDIQLDLATDKFLFVELMTAPSHGTHNLETGIEPAKGIQ